MPKQEREHRHNAGESDTGAESGSGTEHIGISDPEDMVIPSREPVVDDDPFGPLTDEEIGEPDRIRVDGKSTIAAIVSSIYYFAAVYLGDHWPLTPDEAKNIAEPAAGCLDRISPKLTNKLDAASAPVALIIAVATITYPRILLTVRINKEGSEHANPHGEFEAIVRTEPDSFNQGQTAVDDQGTELPSVDPGLADRITAGI